MGSKFIIIELVFLIELGMSPKSQSLADQDNVGYGSNKLGGDSHRLAHGSLSFDNQEFLEALQDQILQWLFVSHGAKRFYSTNGCWSSVAGEAQGARSGHGGPPEISVLVEVLGVFRSLLWLGRQFLSVPVSLVVVFRSPVTFSVTEILPEFPQLSSSGPYSVVFSYGAAVLSVQSRTKWLWRFAKEDDAMWRNVIKAKYGLDEMGWWSKKSSYAHGSQKPEAQPLAPCKGSSPSHALSPQKPVLFCASN
ncbi:hypothetical protein Cgig2_001944 [Carnegiea gigantea]|uniref:Uncharacterized protein n=1 Tax=Carnegiea gigantea TaxID=171969 RepID=A0A9Q1K0B1_9CARY|nr:hypothetical protein Cgig2_001944 [Carnegiea gigantea]